MADGSPDVSRRLFLKLPGVLIAGALVAPSKAVARTISVVGELLPLQLADGVAVDLGAGVAVASGAQSGAMLTTLLAENAEQGRDLEETLDQVEAENEMLAARGISRLSLVAEVQSTKGPKPDSEEATGPAGPAGDDKEGSR